MKKILLILGIFFIDQLSKLLFLRFYPQKVILNKGVIFGFLISNWWFLTSFLFIFLVWFLGRKNWFCWLIIGGGLANLFDRLFRGGVVDFINLKFWPIFNLADVAITIGLLFFLLSIVRQHQFQEIHNLKT